MKLTANIKLQCNKEQHQKLIDTLVACNNACNYVSEFAFTNKIFTQFKLHKAVYYVIREKFNLSAQMAVRCISKVANSYKVSKKTQIQFKKHSAQMAVRCISKVANSYKVSKKTQIQFKKHSAQPFDS